jgi:NADH-quinone oxidoreductase subunit L
MLALYLLLPLVFASAYVALDSSGKFSRYIALAGSLVSLALLPLLQYGTWSTGWFSAGNLAFTITTTVTPISFMLIAIVLFIAPFILFYSFGYMKNRDEQRRFYFQMLTFETAMLLFAMSGNFIVMFIGWEMLSLTSYMLIGFWYWKPSAARAARKTFTIILIGDLSILATMVIFLNVFGSLEFAAIFQQLSSHTLFATLAATLMAIAIFTKSAQFPFIEWLPDAMEGPTPVSAFLHSTTMVKAGVFAAIILLPLFEVTGVIRVMLIISVITAVLAALNASKEKHIKKIIAYSTVQELALMLAAVSSGALVAALYFFFAQSFYKALLFFGSGVVMDANETTDIDKTAGLKSNRLAYITTLFGVLALAGFVPFDGFFANLGLGASFSANLLAYAIISGIGLLTSFYIFRWLFLISRDTRNSEVVSRYQSTPRSMTSAMAVLSVFTLLASGAFFYFDRYLSLNSNYYLNSSLGSFLSSSLQPIGTVTVMAIAVAGMIASYLAFSRRMEVKQKLLNYLIYSSTAMNALYLAGARFLYGFAEGLALFDLYLSDLFDYAGHLVSNSGSYLRRLSSGNINFYALLFAIGLVILTIYIYIV